MAATPVGATTTTFLLEFATKKLRRYDLPVPARPVMNMLLPVPSMALNTLSCSCPRGDVSTTRFFRLFETVCALPRGLLRELNIAPSPASLTSLTILDIKIERGLRCVSAAGVQIVGDLLEGLFTHAGRALQHFHKLVDSVGIFSLDNFG